MIAQPGDHHTTAAPTTPAAAPPRDDDAALVERLRHGDEATFVALIDAYQPSLMRFARTYVSDGATAAEVVQDTWIGLFESLERFEGRSSLKTWLFRILINCARTRVRKDARGIPFSSLFDPADDDGPPSAPDQFIAEGTKAGHWSSIPQRWDELPERRVLAAETRAHLAAAVDALPPAQREVIVLRDIEGLPPADVCNLLGVSDTNQRVLLHRARSRVRAALDAYLSESA